MAEERPLRQILSLAAVSTVRGTACRTPDSEADDRLSEALHRDQEPCYTDLSLTEAKLMSPEQKSVPVKLGAAIHYICRKMANQPDKLGAVKLHKTLWFADVHSYRSTGQTITGGTFIRHQFGPFLKELDQAVADLERADLITVRMVDFREVGKREFIGRGEPDVSLLNERERKWLDQFAEQVCEDHTAGSVSERTHTRLWESAAMFEEIPIAAAAVQFVKPVPSAVAWAAEELERMSH